MRWPGILALALGCACSGESSTPELPRSDSDASHDTDPELPALVQLTVTVVGSSGTVTSTPAGISCPGRCAASFDEGTSVTLTASATSPSELELFEGDCGGTSCTLILSAPRAVTARFAHRPIPRTVFGINMPWIDRGYGVVTDGELVQDRSFRVDNLDPSNTLQRKHYWSDYAQVNGAVTYRNEPGDPTPAGGVAYDGHLTLTTTSEAGSYACVYSALLDQVKQGVSYTVTLSARGVGATHDFGIALYRDSSFTTALGQDFIFASAEADTWTHVSAVLTAVADGDAPILGLCMGLDAGAVDIDEVRMQRTGAEPAVSATTKARLTAMRVGSIRWPGGLDGDVFDWSASVGATLQRGETVVADAGSFKGYQTPAFGLGEFLDLCEELDLEPLIQINVLDTPAKAAELIEYIRGDASSPQGTRRAAHGRAAPWSFAHVFEIGNEPTLSYVESTPASGGADYAARAAAIATAVLDKAQSLGVAVQLSGIVEPSFQLADWLPGNTVPAAQLLAGWNALVWDQASTLRERVSLAHGHFYPYHDDDDDSVQLGFERCMAGGAVFERALSTSVRPWLGQRPLWITEHGVALYLSGTSLVNAARTFDYQAGLSLADLMITFVRLDLEGAHAFSFSQAGSFGYVRDPSAWVPRPTGLMFELLSVLAAERPIPVTAEVSGLTAAVHTVSTGVGIIPSGLSYDKVSVVATRRADANAPRVVLINRDFAESATVTLSVPGFGLGGGDVRIYANADVRANNESSPTAVAIVSESRADASSVTLPPHSVMRIDFAAP